MNSDKERKLLKFINSCQEPEDLLKLPLTRPQAHSLLQYRKGSGNLGSLDELLEVRGIGKRTLEKIENWVVSTKMGESETASRRQQSYLEMKREFLGLVRNSMLVCYIGFTLARKQLREDEKALAFFSGQSRGDRRVFTLISTQRILVFDRLQRNESHVLFSCAVSDTKEQIGIFALKGRYCSVRFLDYENSTYFVISKVRIKIASRVKLLIDGPEFVGSSPETGKSTNRDTAMLRRYKEKVVDTGREAWIEHPRLPGFYVRELYLIPLPGILLSYVFHDVILGGVLPLTSFLVGLCTFIVVVYKRHRYNKRCFLTRLYAAHPGITPAQAQSLIQHIEKHGSRLPALDWLNLEDYEKTAGAKTESRPVVPPDTNPSPRINSKRGSADLTRKQAVWTAIIGYLVLYSPLYLLGKISYGWFIGCAVVGSILGVLALLVALGSLLSGEKRGAIAYSVVVLGVVIALTGAHQQLPSSNVQSYVGREVLQPKTPISDEEMIRSNLSSILSASPWGSIKSINVKPETNGNFAVTIKWTISDTLDIKYWQFEYINLIIDWAKEIFTNPRFANVIELQSSMSAHLADLYGNDAYRSIIISTLSRDITNKVTDWHRFKVNASLNPNAFFQTVAHDVYIDMP